MKTKLAVLFLMLLTGCATPQVHEVHLVVSYIPEHHIERIFTSKAAAQKYIETYKNNHEYFYEQMVLTD
jgi:hypothetical protein